MRVALKVDVDTLRGTREGVPALVHLFESHGVRATFLFSLGPDHTGRAIRRVFRPGFFSKVRRTSVAAHYGLKTLLYGTLLPGPDIARRAAIEMRAAAAAGHEVGIHCFDHVAWQDKVARRDASWTRREMEKAAAAFERVFGRPARTHGAAGWQINPAALRFEEERGFDYASDTRGHCAFLPVMDGERSSCPQIPTTLPTLDELLGRDGITEADVHARVEEAGLAPAPDGHVFTLHAELEGMRLLPVLDRLLQGWRRRGWEIVTTGEIARGLKRARLPRHEVVWAAVEGRSGVLAVQGPALPA